MRAPADVTLVVTLRERFGFAVESLNSMIADTEQPYQQVYVYVGMRSAPRAAIEELRAMHGSALLRTRHFVAPNTARALALAQVRTKAPAAPRP